MKVGMWVVCDLSRTRRQAAALQAAHSRIITNAHRINQGLMLEAGHEPESEPSLTFGIRA